MTRTVHVPLPEDEVEVKDLGLASKEHLEKLVQMMQHRHTCDAVDRHVVLISACCDVSPNGFFLRDLPLIDCIIQMCCARIASGQAQLAPPLVKFLFATQRQFVAIKFSERTRAFNALRCFCARTAQCLSVPSLEVQQAALITLLRFWPGLPGDDYHQQVLEHTDMLLQNVVGCVVSLSSLVAQAADASDRAPIKAVLDDAYRLMQQLSFSHVLGQELLSNPECGICSPDLMSALALCCSFPSNDVCLECTVSVVWNILDAHPQASETFCVSEYFEMFKLMFHNLCSTGFADRQKQTRNELVVCLCIIARNSSTSLWMDSGLFETMMLVATALETSQPADVVKPFVLTNHPIDLECKRAIISSAMFLCSHDNDLLYMCLGQLSLIPCMLLHIDESQLQHPCRRRLAVHQMRELQVMALSALSVLVPYQPELFLRQEGARCVLSLIVHELDEAVRMGCLDFMRSIASNVDVQSEMGSMGAIPIMLSFIADAEVHPLNIRQSAVSILSQLCHDHPDNKVLFDGLDGVAILNTNLFTSSADAVRIEPFLLSVVDCVWSCVAGNDSAEQKFLAARGVLTLLSMLEVCPSFMRSTVLGCITDLSTGDDGRQQLFVWRSKVTKRRVLDLMVEFWDELDVKERENDPAEVAEAHGLEALYDVTVNGSLRLKIWVLLQTLDWGCDIKITAELEAKMAQIRGFLDMREHQLWKCVAKEIVSEGMRPVTPDNRALSEKIEQSCMALEETQAELESSLQHVVQNEHNGDVAFLTKTLDEIEAEKQNIARRRRHAPKDQAQRTKMVPSRPTVPEDVAHTLVPEGSPGVAAEAAAGAAVASDATSTTMTLEPDAYIDEFMADTTIDNIIRALTPSSQKLKERAAARAPPSNPHHHVSPTLTPSAAAGVPPLPISSAPTGSDGGRLSSGRDKGSPKSAQGSGVRAARALEGKA